PFAVLHYGLPVHATNFSTSSSKAQRVKLMMNELPTIEQMKNSLYNIYKDWLPYFTVYKHPFFAHNAGQRHHNTGQILHNAGQGCLLSGCLLSAKYSISVLYLFFNSKFEFVQ